MKAQEWAHGWSHNLDEGERLEAPDNPSGKLRDVLNAAWLSRLDTKGDFDARKRAQNELAKAATDLCQVIINVRKSPTRARVGP